MEDDTVFWIAAAALGFLLWRKFAAGTVQPHKSIGTFNLPPGTSMAERLARSVELRLPRGGAPNVGGY